MLTILIFNQKSLDRNRKTMDRKKSRPQSWPECLTPITLPISYVTDTETQTDNTWPKMLKHNYESEINSWVKYELIVLQKQMLKYNKETFDHFMENLTSEHEERIKVNNQLHHEINKIKEQV